MFLTWLVLGTKFLGSVKASPPPPTTIVTYQPSSSYNTVKHSGNTNTTAMKDTDEKYFKICTTHFGGYGSVDYQ